MKTAAVKAVIGSLQQDKKRLDTLIAILEQQYQAMSERKSQLLEQLNQQATALLDQLKVSHQQRDGDFTLLGLEQNKTGMQTLADALPPHLRQPVQLLLHELSIKSQLCHSLNEKNGKLLAAQRELLNKLTGQSMQNHYPDLPFSR